MVLVLPIDKAEMQAKTRKTVVFLESAAAMGGVQYSTLFLARNLDLAQWRPIVVCPEEGDLTRTCHDTGIEVYVLDQPRLWSTSVRLGKTRLPNPAAWIWNAWSISRTQRRLRNFLSESCADLVLTKGLPSHFLGALAARKLRIPCVWHVQDFISERTFGIYRGVFGWAARWLPQEIIVDGHSIAEQLPQSVRPKTTVIHNGVDTNVFRPDLDGATVRTELGIPDDHLVIGNLGRITPWKGQHYLIEAFAPIARDNSKVTLLLVGSPVFDNDAYQRRLLNTVSRLGLEGRVKLPGYRHDTAEVLSAMDVFAFTSVEKDTSPLALLSAMACGLPIVAFDIAGARELMAGNDQFLLVPVADVAELSSALSSVIADDDLRSCLAAAARKQAVAQFDVEIYSHRIEQVFGNALLDDQLQHNVSIPENHRTVTEFHI
jgi:glycosyltransferase involved in cell wall biosynthesis